MAPNGRNGGGLGDRLERQVTGANGNGGSPAASSNPTNGIKALLGAANVKKRFEEIMDKRAPQYMASIVNLVSMEKALQNVDPLSIIGSALVAATMDLPIDKNLGYAWIVPYSGKAQFQMGYKGYIQLALRTGKYKRINALEIYEGQLIDWDPLTEELKVDLKSRKSDLIIGYAGYFELVNGFVKTEFWYRDEIEAHRVKFSKSDFGWKKDYDAMALKTVIRNMLGKWGILSIEMQGAHNSDMQTIAAKSDEDTGIIDITYESVDDAGGGDDDTPTPPPQQEEKPEKKRVDLNDVDFENGELPLG